VVEGLKQCFKCGKHLPRQAFYRHSKMADGLLGKCKSCTKNDAINHRMKNPERMRESERARRQTPKRRAWAKQYENTPARKRISFAHHKVCQAIIDGKLVKKPCEVCGDKANAHHDDYSKPLDVRWLCTTHHVEHHRMMRKKAEDAG